MQQYVNVITKDKDTREIDANVSRVFTSLIDNPLLGTLNIITAQMFTNGIDLIVNHKLGKAITGFIPVNLNAAAIIYQSSTKNTMPTASVILRANADVMADILFF